MDDQLPPYTDRESRHRPAGLGRLFCILSAVSYGLAALIDFSILISPEFAADFDGGTRTADVATSTYLASGLLVTGAVMALAAIIRGGGHAVRATGVLLLVVAGAAVSVITLPLLDYYA